MPSIDDIKEKTVYEVDGQQFDSRDAAVYHVQEGRRRESLQEFLYDHSGLEEADAALAAVCILEFWIQIKAIKESVSDD